MSGAETGDREIQNGTHKGPGDARKLEEIDNMNFPTWATIVNAITIVGLLSLEYVKGKAKASFRQNAEDLLHNVAHSAGMQRVMSTLMAVVILHTVSGVSAHMCGRVLAYRDAWEAKEAERNKSRIRNRVRKWNWNARENRSGSEIENKIETGNESERTVTGQTSPDQLAGQMIEVMQRIVAGEPPRSTREIDEAIEQFDLSETISFRERIEAINRKISKAEEDMKRRLVFRNILRTVLTSWDEWKEALLGDRSLTLAVYLTWMIVFGRLVVDRYNILFQE